MAKPTKKQLTEFGAYVESLSHLPLVERLFMWTTFAKLRGLDVFARPAHYLATASGTSSAATYTTELVRHDIGGFSSIFLVAEIEHPANGQADIVCSSIKANGNEIVDADVIADAWCDALTSEDQRALPWPIIVPANSSFEMQFTGGAVLNTTGVKVSGFHIDDLTAEVFRFVGELALEGFNKTYAAAAVMDTPIDRTFKREPKELSHIVAKETLTGDAARAAMTIQFKGTKIVPKDQAVIPPLSLRKASARVQIGLVPNDTVQVRSRYTSAGGAGTAKLQVTMIGRRRYTVPDCVA
jgi:hypothetical protein